MSQDVLQSVDVTSIPQVIDCKGVAEAVDGGVVYTSSSGNADNAFTQDVPIEGIVFPGDEQGVVGGGFGAIQCDVFPENLAGSGGEWHVAFFSTFSKDVDLPIFEVDMVDTNPAEFGGPDPSVKQQVEN